MKIDGKTIEAGVPVMEVYIPKGVNGEQGFIIKASGVQNFDKFDELCPAPKPMEVFKVGVGKTQDLDHPKYKKEMEEYNLKRLSYLVIQSLKATEGLTWDTVDEDDPNTWGNYETEFKESGLTPADIGLILQAVIRSNSLDEDHIKAARERFLASKQQQAQTQ